MSRDEKVVIGFVVKGSDKDGRFRQLSQVYTCRESAVEFANLARKDPAFSGVEVHEKLAREKANLP